MTNKSFKHFMSDPIQEWLRERPKVVQDLAQQFPIGSKFDIKGVEHFLIGYTEDEMLIVSPVDPSLDYDDAIAKKVYVCAKHFQ